MKEFEKFVSNIADQFSSSSKKALPCLTTRASFNQTRGTFKTAQRNNLTAFKFKKTAQLYQLTAIQL